MEDDKGAKTGHTGMAVVFISSLQAPWSLLEMGCEINLMIALDIYVGIA